MPSAHGIIRIGVPKYLSSLAGMQADSSLGKLTAPLFQILYTQNANENMLNMFPIAYLNENLSIAMRI